MSENLFETFRRSFPADPAARPFLERPDGSHAQLRRPARPLRPDGQRAGRPGREARGPRRRPGREERRGAACSTSPALRAGAVYLPLNTAYTAGEIRYFLGDAEPTALRLPARARWNRCRPLPAKSACRGWRRLGEERRRQPDGEGRRPRRPGFADVPRDARRPRRHPLHLGHDRALQGRHAEPRQPRLERRGAARRLALHAPRTGCCTPCRSSTPTGSSSPPTSR